jgi:hypothetical protein
MQMFPLARMQYVLQYVMQYVTQYVGDSTEVTFCQQPGRQIRHSSLRITVIVKYDILKPLVQRLRQKAAIAYKSVCAATNAA